MTLPSALRRSRPSREAERRAHEARKGSEGKQVAEVALHRGSMVAHKLVPERETCKGVQEYIPEEARQAQGDQDSGTEARERGVGGLDPR